MNLQLRPDVVVWRQAQTSLPRPQNSDRALIVILLGLGRNFAGNLLVRKCSHQVRRIVGILRPVRSLGFFPASVHPVHK